MAQAKSCVIADAQDTALNVRDAPNGRVINRLRNGRKVEISKFLNDSKGRPWGYANGKYKGNYRNWGWVFMASLDCASSNEKDLPAKLSCIVADPLDPTLNVRSSPNGTVINRLRNGRKINVTRIKKDLKGRPWGYAVGDYKGRFRQWGWVFMRNIDCNNTPEQNNKYWIQIASREAKSEAIDIARTYATNFSETMVFSAENGWYAIVIKPVTDGNIQTIIQKLKLSGVIPNDSYATQGKSFINTVWSASENNTTVVATKTAVNRNKPLDGELPKVTVQQQEEFSRWLFGN